MVRALAFAVLAGAAPAIAQQAAGGRPLERIAAVVGSKAILASHVEEQFVQLQAQGAPIPEDSAGRAALRRRILDQMIEEELLVQEAERDTAIKVTDQEVQDAVEQSVQNVRREFTAERDFQSQLRLAGFQSVEEWRRWLAENQRRAILRQRLIESLRQQGKLRPIPPTDAQMRAFWEANRGQLPKRPATASFRQIVIASRPDSAARVRAFLVAESLAVALRRGADFATVARRFSDDTATREAGGEVGWFRRGVMVREFEAVAFRLRPGEISDPVETEFGFHVIRVDRAQPAEVLARHVLIRPEVSPPQVEEARRLADSVRARLAAGASFDSLARRYGDPNEPRLVEQTPVAQLPPDYQSALGTDTVPGLKPVFATGAGGPRPKFVVLELVARPPEGDLTFDEVKDRVRDRLAQDLAIQHYLGQLRRRTYVDVRF